MDINVKNECRTFVALRCMNIIIIIHQQNTDEEKRSIEHFK